MSWVPLTCNGGAVAIVARSALRRVGHSMPLVSARAQRSARELRQSPSPVATCRHHRQAPLAVVTISRRVSTFQIAFVVAILQGLTAIADLYKTLLALFTIRIQSIWHLSK